MNASIERQGSAGIAAQHTSTLSYRSLRTTTGLAPSGVPEFKQLAGVTETPFISLRTELERDKDGSDVGHASTPQSPSSGLFSRQKSASTGGMLTTIAALDNSSKEHVQPNSPRWCVASPVHQQTNHAIRFRRTVRRLTLQAGGEASSPVGLKTSAMMISNAMFSPRMPPPVNMFAPVGLEMASSAGVASSPRATGMGKCAGLQF